jgi:hypothetical protein
MLERYMEEAVANCPDLFIEPGLALVRRQVVISGRRPDVLFTDAFSRHLLVEIQSGRLDEDHLQRHFYYYFDYRAKYPGTHLRLMFIANRLIPQHKEFLDEHGYEYREYPEQEFERKISACSAKAHPKASSDIEVVTTPGVLAESTYELLYDIETQPMTLCYKMLLLEGMCELTNDTGRVPLESLAERFQEFFVLRSTQGKAEENPNRVKSGILSNRSLSEWMRVIRDQPVHYLTESFVVDEGTWIRWAPRVWGQWNHDLKREILAACRDRLVRYFNRYVPGGF